ncbi:MAG: hypothetical protein GKR84_05010 [Candidatus Nanopelagicales bacterium]|nr:hypothetical protein [Candidatus Nanopelagicales bacterium]
MRDRPAFVNTGHKCRRAGKIVIHAPIQKIFDIITFTKGPLLNVSPASEVEVQGLTVTAADPAHAAQELVASGMSQVDKHSVRVGSLTVTIES